jgi:hypothetical protein
MELPEKFYSIEDIVRDGDYEKVDHRDIEAEVAEIVEFNIKDYWGSSSIPSITHFRWEVANIVAKILVEHTRFYLSADEQVENDQKMIHDALYDESLDAEEKINKIRALDLSYISLE